MKLNNILPRSLLFKFSKILDFGCLYAYFGRQLPHLTFLNFPKSELARQVTFKMKIKTVNNKFTYHSNDVKIITVDEVL